MLGRLLPVSFIALLLAFLQFRSGVAASYVPVIAVVAVLAYVIMASGTLLLAATRPRRADPAAVYVAGLAIVSLGSYVLVVVFPITAAVAFGAVATAVIALDIAFARRRAAPPMEWRSLIGFALCVALTAAWSNGPSGAYEVVRTQGFLPVWSDYFFHGSVISQFGDVRSVGHQSILLADFPPSFYHFASYIPAAVLAGMLDQPGLPLATSAWMPMGLLSMAAGAYVLGEGLAGAAGGLAALLALLVLPDASNYGLRNGIMSFHWSVLAHPGATYGLGIAFLSLAYLERWSRERSLAALVASAALAASVFFFRVHIFLLYVPAWAAALLYCRARDTHNRRLVALLIAVALGAAAFTASFVLMHIEQANPGAQWRFGEPALGKFLLDLHVSQEPTAYDGFYANLMREGTPGMTLTVGIVLAVLAALGAFSVLLPIAVAVGSRLRVLRAVDVFPAYTGWVWLLLLLCAPVTWGNASTDLVERPIVLLYAIAAVWTTSLALRSLAERFPRIAGTVWVWLLAGSLAAIPLMLATADGMARPKFRWGAQHIAEPLEPGLVKAAAFLRAHAAVGDVFATAGLNGAYTTFDLPMTLCSLSGMPAYLSRPHIELAKGPLRRRVVAARLAALREVEAQRRYRDAVQLLKRMRVRWYVVAGKSGPRWDPQRKAAVFSAGSVTLYDAST